MQQTRAIMQNNKAEGNKRRDPECRTPHLHTGPSQIRKFQDRTTSRIKRGIFQRQISRKLPRPSTADSMAESRRATDSTNTDSRNASLCSHESKCKVVVSVRGQIEERPIYPGLTAETSCQESSSLVRSTQHDS